MATLTALQAQIARFEANEARADIMVNAPNNEASYQTRTGKGVETYPHLVARLGTNADSILAKATAQADRAETEAERAEFAADVAVNTIPAIVTEGNAQVERVRSEGQAHTEAACTCAEEACVCAQEARQAVASIPGIEAAQYTVNAFSIVEGQLVWFQGREGDVMRAADYDLALGPEHSQIYYSLNNGGELVRHIPVAPPAI